MLKRQTAICVLFLTVLLLNLGLKQPVKAAGASLYFSPSSGTVFAGSTFNVSVFLNTSGADVNAVKIKLKFDPKKLQIVSPTAGKSFISVWVAQPSYSNTLGTAAFQGGAPSPGINTSDGLVSTITFRAISPGQALVSFIEEDCAALLNDGQGTDILSSFGRAVYNLAVPPPEGPKIFSSTHPDQNKWSKNNNPSFNWEKESGVTDFSWLLNNEPQDVPDNISEGAERGVFFSEAADGIWYFHLKAKRAGAWGGTSHYLAQIDTSPPADFSLVFEPTLANGWIASQEPVVSFITTDALSGLDYFKLKTVDLREGLEGEEAGFFTEAESPYRFPLLGLGKHLVIVRAYDKAGNWREVSRVIEVMPPHERFFISAEVLFFCRWFLPGWFLAGFLILVLVVFGFLLYFLYRYYRQRKIQANVLTKVTKRRQDIKNNQEDYYAL